MFKKKEQNKTMFQHCFVSKFTLSIFPSTLTSFAESAEASISGIETTGGSSKFLIISRSTSDFVALGIICSE